MINKVMNKGFIFFKLVLFKFIFLQKYLKNIKLMIFIIK